MSPVNTTKATIVVNLKSGHNQGKTTVSGKLDINSLLQNKCDQVLREYESDERYLARQKLKKLLKQYPKSMVVKHLYIYILYSALCTGSTTVSISATSTIVMSFNTARLFDDGTFGPVGTTITFQQGTSTSRSGIIIADANLNSLVPAANPTGGNPMPAGTTIAFSIDGSGASLVGITSWTVASTSAPTGTYGVTLRAAAAALAADLPSPMPTLLLTITTPGSAATQFSWPITVTL